MSRQPSSFPTDVKHCLGRPSSVQIGRSTTMAASTCPNAFDTSLCLESTTTGIPAAALPVHRQATRYADDLPRDEACLVASEEGHNACEVFRETNTTQRNRFDHFFEDLERFGTVATF